MNDDDTPQPTSSTPRSEPGVQHSPLDVPVVGIGASVGGVAALVELFRHMPPDPGMAFVVVMGPHDDRLDGLLAEATPLPVIPVLDKIEIRPNHIYMIPLGRQPALAGGQLQVRAFESGPGSSTPIDLFFRALADAERERAVCIVLSGTGSDGSAGLQRVKEYGGITLAQIPEEAECGDMPSGTIATGAVDVVLPVCEMGARLVALSALWSGLRRTELPAPASALAAADDADLRPDAMRAEQALGDVMTLLQRRTGHDFRHYKRATVLRRLERRWRVNGVADLSAYRDRLESHPLETQSLLKELLIGVTSFFRDPEAFAALDAELSAVLQRRADPGGRLRAWVAGCATGEEAYSVAMLLAEKTAELRLDLDLQVFASDIDEQSITTARAGLYADSIVTEVAPVRLRQFFQKEQAQVRVRRELRERVVFAVHDLLRDPPFSQLDLVSCRNLLTYLDRDVQIQVLEIFHFALKPGGLLFLGDAESAEPAGDLFLPVDRTHRIYRANGMGRGARPSPALSIRELGQLTATLPKPEARTALASLHESAREGVGPSSVLVDADGNILHSTARAGGFLRFVAGAPSQNVLDAVRPELRLELRAALIQSWRERKSVQARRVEVESGPSSTVWVCMTVHPVDDPGTPLMLVLFDQTDATLGPEAAGTTTRDPVQVMLEEELRRTREELRATLGESAQSTEDLRASNQELQAINEELHSTTEALEGSREELQSVNARLVAVNEALNAKVEETSRINDDLENLIASTDIATVFVDRDMRIKRFTPSATRLFGLEPADVGRSLLDIGHRFDYPLLEADSMQAFQSLSTIEREVHGAGGRVLLARVRPYRTRQDVIDGAALTFLDITDTRRAEERLIAGEASMNLVAENTRDFAIITIDIEGRVTGWNVGARRIFGFEETEIVGQPIDLIYTPEDRAAGMAQKEMGRALADGRGIDERWHLAKDGSSFYCSGIMTPLFEQGAHVGYAKIARDLTESKKAEAQLQALLVQEKETRAELQRATMLKDEFLAVMSHELKQPLNLIHVNAELMSRLPEVRQAPPVARAADVIRRAVLSQAKIIDDLLDLSRLRTGKLGLAVGSVDWTVIVTKVLDAIEGDAKAQQLNVTRDDAAAPVLILADPVRVEQIVWNLLSNAIKFTPAGGTIGVTLGIEGNLGRLDVVDSGQGIDPEFLSDVFDMFRQADRSTTRPQGGMGIGLALVRQLAEAQGGKVAASSAGKGLGAHFRVWLPLLEGDAHDPVGRGAAAPALAGLRVLAVDDSADVLESFAALLRLEGAEVTALGSGAEALRALDNASFDILLSDVAMPAMDGYELISTLRGDPRTARLPAVALTGFGRPEDARRAFAAGFDAHLPKPIVVDELLRTVSRLLDDRLRGHRANEPRT